MLRYFCWTASLFVVSTALTTGIAQSESISIYPQYPETQKSKANEPLCYMQTADGRILDLQKMCSENSFNHGVYSPTAGSRFRRDCTLTQCGGASQIRQPLDSEDN